MLKEAAMVTLNDFRNKYQEVIRSSQLLDKMRELDAVASMMYGLIMVEGFCELEKMIFSQED